MVYDKAGALCFVKIQCSFSLLEHEAKLQDFLLCRLSSILCRLGSLFLNECFYFDC